LASTVGLGMIETILSYISQMPVGPCPSSQALVRELAGTRSMCQLIRLRVRHAGCKEKSRFGIVVGIRTTAANRAGTNPYHLHAARGDASLSLNRSPVFMTLYTSENAYWGKQVWAHSVQKCTPVVPVCIRSFEPRHVGKTYRKHFDSIGGCSREGEHEIDSESPVGWSASVRVIRYERSDLRGLWRMRIGENLLQLLRSAKTWYPTAEFVRCQT
jgi:hypothetical protein